MARRRATISGEVDRYLRTGETDPLYETWLGDLLDRAQQAKQDLRGALIREVHRLARGLAHAPVPQGDGIAFTRGRVTPMVRGLFPRAEQGTVLAALEKSVVFLTSSNVESLLREHPYDGSAWDLANLHLAGVGADLLGENAPSIVGMSEETTCYVSPSYFREGEPFADFVVHEVAHVFHNCKRRTLGLRQTRTKEWLLDVEFRKRETFAYACEAYACVLTRAKSPAERRALAAEYGRIARISDERVDVAEVAGIVADASAARNGWKIILARCAPASRPMTPLEHVKAAEVAAAASRRGPPPR